jgi:hypothetical protein
VVQRRREPGGSKGTLFVVGVASAPLSTWAASGLHGPGRIAVAFILLIAPTWTLETWHKQRKRQREEWLIPELEQAR